MDLEHTQFTSTILSKNTESKGFDTQAGQTWIYPTNYQERLYQYNIIQEALYKNTLVSLPTGLGKTFIAAVVMYNYYRWYPTGKVVFVAPTKPLVKQQIDACYEITAIPKDVTTELTGMKIQTSRIDVWKEKRVFFVTPQVLQNDLDNVPDLASKIKCLVFDEAHKAKGNHSYCEVIRKMIPQSKYFRVLALSATPGSTVNDVIEVTSNLLISHLELRTDESPDVTPYVFQRSLETIVVPLGGKLQQVKNEYMQILEQYTRVLVTHKVIHGNCGNISKGRIFMTMKEFQERNRHTKMPAYGEIMRSLNICVTLYHGYELLLRNGLRSFLNFFEEHGEKPLLRGSATLQGIIADVAEYLGPKPNVSVLPDGSTPEIPENTKFGHPKFYKLRDLLLSHFSQVDDESSRAIVFSEYRESVIEVHALLTQHKPTIKSRIFMGQGAITQREQINTVKAFREGQCNTLISTCIGEEGLDIGDVDLIVCFDITNKSPVRMVQRMGRTGRKRKGRVVVLVSEGKEQQTLKECLIHKHNLSNHILKSQDLNKKMYRQNPRMVPEDITPTCQKMHITFPKVKIKQKSANLKDMLTNMASRSESPTLTQELKDIPIIDVYTERIPPLQSHWNKANPFDVSPGVLCIDFSKRLEKLRILQPTDKFGHSANTEILVSLLQFADSKRYNIPTAQLPQIFRQLSPSSPKKKGRIAKCGSLDNFVQRDIRTMFTRHKSFDVATEVTQAAEIFQTQPSKKQTTQENELLNELHHEIANYLSISYSTGSSCLLCDNLFPCFRIKDESDRLKLSEWTQPDLKILDTIDNDNLELFLESFHDEIDVDVEIPENSSERVAKNSFLFTPPKSIKEVFDKCDIEGDMVEVVDLVEKSVGNELAFARLIQRYVHTLHFFDLNVVGDIFDATILSNDGDVSPILGSYDRTRFFDRKVGRKLDKNDESFCEKNQSVIECNFDETIASIVHESPKLTTKTPVDKKIKPNLSNLMKQSSSKFYTKSMTTHESREEKQRISNLSEDLDVFENFNVVLDSKIVKRDVSEQHVQELMSNINDFCDFSVFELDSLGNNRKPGTLDNQRLNAINSEQRTKSLVESSKKNSCVDVTSNSDDLFDDSLNLSTNKGENRLTIGDCCDLSMFGLSSKEIVAKQSVSDKLNIDDVCDLSIFGMDANVEKPVDVKSNENIDNNTLGIGDICDLSSIFDLDRNNLETIETKQNINRISNSPVIQLEKKVDKDEIKKHEEINSKVLDIYDICDTSIFGIDTKNSSTVTTASTSINLSDNAQKSSNKLSTNINSIVSKYIPAMNDCCDLTSSDSPVKRNDNYISVTQAINLMDKPNENRRRAPKGPTVNLPLLSELEDEKSFTNHNFGFKNKRSKLALSVKAAHGGLDKQRSRTTPKKDVKFRKKATPERRKIGFDASSCALGNSDDDFDLSPMATNGWIKPKNKSQPKPELINTIKKKIFDEPAGSSQDFDSASFKTNRGNKNKIKIRSKTRAKKKPPACGFIETEAKLSSDENAVSDTASEGGSSDDVFESSFINDDTINVENTSMHVQYLKSVRSPLLNRGTFKIGNRAGRKNIDVFSQVDDYTDNTYVNDSFCINSEETDLTQNDVDMSELEVAEMLLRQRKRKKKKSQDGGRYNKCRIIILSSDSE